MLAKDEIDDYTGPDWVPFNLWTQFASGASHVRDCARRLILDPGAQKLWRRIVDQYGVASNALAFALPERCAEILNEWHALPKLSPSEYREAMLKLARRANALTRELQRFDRGGEYFDPSTLTFFDLLSEPEQGNLGTLIRRHNLTLRNRALMEAGRDGELPARYAAGQESGAPEGPLNPSRAMFDSTHTWELIDAIVPTLPEILRRVAALFDEKAANPPLERPTSQNAERNYFARRLWTFFDGQHGNASPTIIADITSRFFAQGITANEVAKLANRLPSGRIKGELSTPK